MEDRIIYSDNVQVVEKLNKFFIKAVHHLEIEPCLRIKHKLLCRKYRRNCKKIQLSS